MKQLLFTLFTCLVLTGCGKSYSPQQPSTALESATADQSSTGQQSPAVNETGSGGWKQSDVVGRTLVYRIGEDFQSSSHFAEGGELRGATGKIGEAPSKTTMWQWTIDSDGCLITTCKDPMMEAKFQLISRLDDGVITEMNGTSNGEVIPTTTITMKYAQLE